MKLLSGGVDKVLEERCNMGFMITGAPPRNPVEALERMDHDEFVPADKITRQFAVIFARGFSRSRKDLISYALGRLSLPAQARLIQRLGDISQEKNVPADVAELARTAGRDLEKLIFRKD